MDTAQLSLGPLPPLVGDIVFTRWQAWDSRATEWITNGRAAHQEQICCDGDRVAVIAASAAMNRMNIWEWTSRKNYFARTHTDWCRFTPTDPLNNLQRAELRDYFQEAANTYRYSKGELALQALDSFRNWLLNIPYDSVKAVRWRKLGDIDKAKIICSKAGNGGLIILGLLPEWATYWSPSDTLNKVSSSTSWQLAESSSGFFANGSADQGGSESDVSNNNIVIDNVQKFPK